MALSYPLFMPAQGVRSITMRMRDQVAVSTSPYTGQQQVYAHPGQWWEADVAFPPMKQDGLADDMTAFLAACRGQYGTFLLGDSSRKTPRGSISTTSFPRVGAGSQAGQSLALVGVPTGSAAWRAGDYVQIGGENLLLRSTEFDHSAWSKSDGLCSTGTDSNAFSDPAGGTSADRFRPTGASPYIAQGFTPPGSGEYTGSVWMRAESGTVTGTMYIIRSSPFTVVASQSFSANSSGFTRLSVSGFISGTDAHSLQIGAPVTGNVILWGAQVNRGRQPDGYTQTSTSIVSSTRRLHKILRDCTAASDGSAILDIWPRLREAPVSGHGIISHNAQGTFRLADNVREWSVDEAKIYGVGISAVEAL